MKREGNLYDLKVNLDYFKTNLDLKKLIKKLNKRFINVYFDHPVKHFKGNQLFDRIVESTKKLTEFQKLLICNPIDLCEDQKQRKKLDNLKDIQRDGIIGPRKKGKIGFSVIRGGDIVGNHSVIFAGPGEQIIIKHNATDRMIFARGALKAAKWGMTAKKGEYSMQDVLNLN